MIEGGSMKNADTDSVCLSANTNRRLQGSTLSFFRERTCAPKFFKKCRLTQGNIRTQFKIFEVKAVLFFFRHTVAPNLK